MHKQSLKAAAALTVLAFTCGLARAADDRPHALPASMLAAATHHTADPGLRAAIGNLERPDLRHDVDDDGHDGHGHGEHHHHPCTPE